MLLLLHVARCLQGGQVEAVEAAAQRPRQEAGEGGAGSTACPDPLPLKKSEARQ